MSSYLDKMAQGRDQSVWRLIARQLGLDERGHYTPIEILDRVSSVSPQDLDPHIAPQTINLFFGHIEFDRIFRLEELPDTQALEFSQGRSLKLIDIQSHSTSGRSNHRLFDAETLEAIDAVYVDDYSNFGYDPDIEMPISTVRVPAFRPLLLNLLASHDPVHVVGEFVASNCGSMSYLEAGAVIDVFSKHGLWGDIPSAIMDSLVARDILLQADNLERFVVTYADSIKAERP